MIEEAMEAGEPKKLYQPWGKDRRAADVSRRRLPRNMPAR